MSTHVIKRYERKHEGTGNWEDWRSHFISFDGPNAPEKATECMQALAYGFIADMMKEGFTIRIDQDERHIIRVEATNGSVTETITYIRTDKPNDYPNYNRMSEHNEI